VPVCNRWQYGASAGSVCKAARSLVVPDQSHNILVYLQPVAPVFSLIRRKKACSVTSSPRPTRCNLGSNVVL